jgi:LPS sulfotransferase NodH
MGVTPTIVRHLLMQIASMGSIPAELHMSQQTRDELFATAAPSDCRRPSASFWDRWWNWVFRLGEQPWTLFGVRVVLNSAMNDGGVIVRPLHMVGKENWLEIVAADGLRNYLHAQSKVELEHQPPAEMTAAAEQTMSRTAGKSVTDILIDAATNCDDIRTVIVITVKNDNEVVVRGNADKFGISGVLNAVLNTMEGGE